MKLEERIFGTPCNNDVSNNNKNAYTPVSIFLSLLLQLEQVLEDMLALFMKVRSALSKENELSKRICLMVTSF